MATPARRLGNALVGMYGAARNVVSGLFPRFGGFGFGRLRLFLPSARFDWEREAGELWMNSVVSLSLSWLGDRFPRPKIVLGKLTRSGDMNPIGRHPVADLWNHPNEYYTRRTLEKAIGLSLKTDGNAYIQKVRNNGGDVVELWWVPHYRIWPTWPDDGSAYIDGYKIRVDNGVYWLPRSEIIHIRDGIDPLNERFGLAPLKANAREVCGLNLASSYTAALLKNSGVPGLAIIPDGPEGARPDIDAARRIEEKYQEKFTVDDAGKVIVMAGRYKIQEVGFSPEKLALHSLNRDAEARVASAIGVAAMSLGLPDPNKTYSNLGEANRASWGTIQSIQELIAEAVAHQLFPDFKLDPLGYVFSYDYSEIDEMRESLDAVHTRTRDDFRFDLLRKNEARELLGFEPDPDGDIYFSDVQLMLAQAKAGAGAAAAGGGGNAPSDEPASASPPETAPRDTGPTDNAPSETETRLGKRLQLNGHPHPRWEY